MYIKYADRKKICEKLAAYRVGEIVAVLTDTECEDGLIEAQTIHTNPYRLYSGWDL